jgi:hypothetical protein
MLVRQTTVPDIARPGVGLVMASLWRVSTPEQQRAAVEAVGRAWRSREWPDPGPLSYSVLTGNDGVSLFHYSQWRDAEAARGFVRTHRGERNAEIDAAVPGIERVGLEVYELYRSESADRHPPGSRSPDSSSAGDGGAGGVSRVPGCVVIVDVEFVGADAARQRDWTDAVFDAIESDPDVAPGGIAAHFHVSTNGTRVLNYAEWETAQAHADALGAPGDGVGSSTEQWARVRNYPGLKGSTVNRYTPAISLAAE